MLSRALATASKLLLRTSLSSMLCGSDDDCIPPTFCATSATSSTCLPLVSCPATPVPRRHDSGVHPRASGARMNSQRGSCQEKLHGAKTLHRPSCVPHIDEAAPVGSSLRPA